MKVRAHTKFEERADPRQLFFGILPRCGARISHYIIRPSGAFALGNSRLAPPESRSLDLRERASHDHGPPGMTVYRGY